MLFDFLEMAGDYAQRKVARFDGNNGLSVDTAAVNDSDKPYETAVMDPRYNKGNWVIVELYDTKEEAEKGHAKWVAIMTAPIPPVSLLDVSTAGVAKLCDTFEEEGVNSWREKGMEEAK